MQWNILSTINVVDGVPNIKWMKESIREDWWWCLWGWSAHQHRIKTDFQITEEDSTWFNATSTFPFSRIVHCRPLTYLLVLSFKIYRHATASAATNKTLSINLEFINGDESEGDLGGSCDLPLILADILETISERRPAFAEAANGGTKK